MSPRIRKGHELFKHTVYTDSYRHLPLKNRQDAVNKQSILPQLQVMLMYYWL